VNEAKVITPVKRPIRGRIRPPGSKSLTNRALTCAALARGRSTLRGALDSDDTRVMVECLRRLGLTIDREEGGRRLIVDGCGGAFSEGEIDLFVGNSGTTVRFLTAATTIGRGIYHLDGIERMRQRPIADLIEALTELGADVRSDAGNGCPPVVVHGRGLAGGRARVRGDVSSQFLSGLLMAAPYAIHPVELLVEGPLVSKPYVEMTLPVMRNLGVAVDVADELSRFTVSCLSHYEAQDYQIEPDASAASYFFAAAAITGGEITVEGLTRQSLQGDVAFCDCLAQMGCTVTSDADSITVRGGLLRGITVDMNAISDTVQTLATVALFAEGPTRITHVGHIRHKETDRIGDLARELRRLGAEVEEHEDGLTIVPAPLSGAQVETYDDHRMAMSVALAGLKVEGVAIKDPQCTAKTYPDFFEDLERVAFA